MDQVASSGTRLARTSDSAKAPPILTRTAKNMRAVDPIAIARAPRTAFAASSRISVRASSTSWRTSRVTSEATSLTIAATDGVSLVLGWVTARGFRAGSARIPAQAADHEPGRDRGDDEGPGRRRANSWSSCSTRSGPC